MTDPSGPATELLRAAEGGDVKAAERLFPLIYDELRRIAQREMSGQPPGQTLQTTALVHEAYLRLMGTADQAYRGRAHFLSVAALAMRQILVDHARRKASVKYGGAGRRVPLERVELAYEITVAPEELIALDEALERLEERNPLQGRIVMLRYFAGLTIEETATAVDVSPATVKRHWQFAKAWLYREISGRG